MSFFQVTCVFCAVLAFSVINQVCHVDAVPKPNPNRGRNFPPESMRSAQTDADTDTGTATTGTDIETERWEEIGHSFGKTVLHDTDIQPHDRTVVDIFKIQSLVGPRYILTFTCEGETDRNPNRNRNRNQNGTVSPSKNGGHIHNHAHKLPDKMFYEFVLIKKQGSGSKELSCASVKLLDGRDDSVLKEARDVRVASMDDSQFYNVHNIYFYGYGYGSYGGPFGTWVYQGRW